MKLNEIATKLRDVSARYGGIEHYLSAAGALDSAISAFFKEQDIETLRALNGAVARCEKYRKALSGQAPIEGDVA